MKLSGGVIQHSSPVLVLVDPRVLVDWVSVATFNKHFINMQLEYSNERAQKHNPMLTGTQVS